MIDIQSGSRLGEDDSIQISSGKKCKIACEHGGDKYAKLNPTNSSPHFLLPHPLPPLSLPLFLSMGTVIILTAADESAESFAADARVTV